MDGKLSCEGRGGIHTKGLHLLSPEPPPQCVQSKSGTCHVQWVVSRQCFGAARKGADLLLSDVCSDIQVTEGREASRTRADFPNQAICTLTLSA